MALPVLHGRWNRVHHRSGECVPRSVRPGSKQGNQPARFCSLSKRYRAVDGLALPADADGRMASPRCKGGRVRLVSTVDRRQFSVVPLLVSRGRISSQYRIVHAEWDIVKSLTESRDGPGRGHGALPRVERSATRGLSALVTSPAPERAEERTLSATSK